MSRKRSRGARSKQFEEMEAEHNNPLSHQFLGKKPHMARVYFDIANVNQLQQCEHDKCYALHHLALQVQSSKMSKTISKMSKTTRRDRANACYATNE